jgi:AcrR family transcriptional regulator
MKKSRYTEEQIAFATAKRWTGRSLDARRAERREMLIAAGVRLYGTQGFHGTGVRAICREAGLTERYLCEGFANGEELLLAAFNKVIQALLTQIVEADEPGKAAEHRVRRMLGAYYAALRAHPAAARVFLVEIEVRRCSTSSLWRHPCRWFRCSARSGRGATDLTRKS